MSEKCEIFEDQISALESRVRELDKTSCEENVSYFATIKELEGRIIILSSTTELAQTRQRVKYLEVSSNFQLLFCFFILYVFLL
jgi:hypothetical protein